MSEWTLTEKPYSQHMVEQEIQRRRGEFINGFLEKKRGEYDTAEKFEKARGKLTKEAEKRWQLIREARSKLLDLEEKMHVEVMKWSAMEALYRQWLEAADYPKEVVENTIKGRRITFETAQHNVRERRRSAAYNPAEDFKRRMLNTETRQEAVRYFLHDRADKAHWLIETIQLLFVELEKVRRG